MQMALHLIDTIQYLLGDIELTKISRIDMRETLKTENAESYSVSFLINKTVIAHLFSSYLAQETFFINLYFMHGSVLIDPFNGLFIQHDGEFKYRRLGLFKNEPEITEIKLFYKAIKKNIKYSQPTVNCAIKNVELIEKFLN
jgi:predicted dehydrogenase